jgi:hypothetical protein
MTDGQERVRLRAREGEAVEWTRRVAQRAGTLKDMMDDAPPEDGVYPVPTIAAAELAVLREMCEADSMPARLEQCSISELFRLVEGASFLDAPGALNHAQRALASRLNGKRADELREQLLGATDGFGSAEERVAALAEPAFSPEGQQSEATVGYAGGAPALQPQLTLWMAVTDDAKEVALGMVDVVTLAELKGVSQSWLALARRVLCSRLSRCEGQPLPTELAEITDLNIKVLVDAGRPWEAAAAGRMLPSLARLRWEGFEVSVAAVREVDLETPRQEREFLGGRAKAALLSCIEGEGEPPLELLLAAVACAGSGEICGIPVQMMRDDSVSELYLQERNIGVEGGMLLAYLVPVTGGLTSLDLSSNQLCGLDYIGRGDYTAEGITAIADAMRVNGVLTSLNLSSNDIGGYWDDDQKTRVFTPVGPKAIADALLVNGALTMLSLAQNMLGEEGTKAICEALEQNKKLKELDISGAEYEGNIGGSAGAKHVAKMLGVNGALTSVDVGWNDITGDAAQELATVVLSKPTLEDFCNIPIKKLRADSLSELDLSGCLCPSKGVGVPGALVLANLLPVTGALTSIDLRGNKLGDKGWGAIFAAICGSKDSKIIAMDTSYEKISPAGVKLIAEALRTSVTGALTELSIYGNHVGDEGVGAICEAIQSNKETKLASLNFGKTGISPVGANAVAAMVAVMGGLTSLDLSGNQLCGLDLNGRGTYTAEGITAIAEALGVNRALTKIE